VPLLSPHRAIAGCRMNSQQQQFERAVEELAERVNDFHKHTDLARINKVVGMVKDIEKALKDYEERAKVFNAREQLFNTGSVTEYDQLQKIVKDFEPYWALPLEPPLLSPRLLSPPLLSPPLLSPPLLSSPLTSSPLTSSPLSPPLLSPPLLSPPLLSPPLLSPPFLSTATVTGTRTSGWLRTTGRSGRRSGSTDRSSL
jgi:hypothetical protein